MKLNEMYAQTDEWKFKVVITRDKRLAKNIPPSISASI
jgi:hypothetical protein